MAKATDPKSQEPTVIGTPTAEEARLVREQTTGSPLTEGEQDMAEFQERADNAVINRGEEALQNRDANARMVMADEATSVAAPTDSQIDRNDKYVKRFAKLSGYDVGEVDAFNPSTLVFVTSSGGKYRLNKAGTQIQHLSGPVIPALRQG